MEQSPMVFPPLPMAMATSNISSSSNPWFLLRAVGRPRTESPQEEGRDMGSRRDSTMLAYRKELERLFNTSKSNKHLWEQISQKMRERVTTGPHHVQGQMAESPKDYRKLKHQQKPGHAQARIL